MVGEIAAVTQQAECRSSKPDGVGSRPTRCIRIRRSSSGGRAPVFQTGYAGSIPAHCLFIEMPW